MSSIHADSTDGLCHPGRIAGKNRVVFRCTRKFYKTKFHHELVDDLLDLFFSKCSLCEITLCINI